MSVNELERVKQDIATIKDAAGLELPFGWDSVWMNLIGVPSGAVWFLVFFLISDTTYRYMMVVPWTLLLAVVVYLRRKKTRSSGRPAIRRRKFTVTDYGTIVITVAMIGILVALAKDDTVYLASGLLIMFGLMGTLVAVHSRARLSDLGSAIPAILAGIFLAIWPSPDGFLPIVCITFIVGGPAKALIMMYQLKQAGQTNDAN